MTTNDESAQRRMMVLRIMREALDVDTDGRAAWLEVACGADADLRRDVSHLLTLDVAAQGPLDVPLLGQMDGLDMALDSAIDARLGQQIGPYRLQAVLGRGGMGTVYRAERCDGSFEQVVAVNLLRFSTEADGLAYRDSCASARFWCACNTRTSRASSMAA